MKPILNVIMSFSILYFGACNEATIDPNKLDQKVEISDNSKNTGKSTSSARNPGDCKYIYPDNCTLYVSCRLGAGGFNQWGFDASNYTEKASLINTTNGYIPTYGDVAIFDTGSQWGHMAFVEWRDINTYQIWVSETNWNGQDFNWRSLGTGGPYPKLVGYHHPGRP
jgi:hypothetical protein